MDILWSRYVQGQFIKSKLETSFKKQESMAMQQLNGLWNLLEEKRMEADKLEREVCESILLLSNTI